MKNVPLLHNWLGWVILMGLSVGCLHPAQGQFSSFSLQTNVFRPAPRNLKQHLSRARRAIDEERYSTAVEELYAILAAGGSQEREEAAQQTQDYFYSEVGGGRLQVQSSIKAEAQKLLGSMPARARQLYELRCGAEARALLDAAIAAGNSDGLAEVARRFFHTEAGYEATMLLGRMHLDQGRPIAAALQFRRLISAQDIHPQYRPELPLLLASCWLQAGLEDQAAATISSINLHDALRMGDENLARFQGVAEAIRWLQQRAQVRGAGTVDHEWTMFLGDATRSGRANGDMTLGNGRWHVPLVFDPGDRKIIAEIERDVSVDLPAIVSAYPLAVNDTILMRTPDALFGIASESGKRVWQYPLERRTDYLENSLGANVASVRAARRTSIRNRLWDDSGYGQFSSDGSSVFIIDDPDDKEPKPVRLDQGQFQAWINPRQTATVANRLVALDLAGEGKLRWMVGGKTGEAVPELANAFFLGVPLPLQGRLYALIEVLGEIRVVVLDADTGKLEWSQQLAHVESLTITRDPQRRLAGVSPSFSDGILICPTSAGALVAIDVSTRTLLWGYQYKQRGSTRSRRFNYPMPTGSEANRWLDSAVRIVDGNVLLTPIESEEIHCLDLLTGKSKWAAPRPRAKKLFIAGVHDDAIVFVERHGLSAIRLSDGAPLQADQPWGKAVQLGEEVLITGRGFQQGQYYFAPTSEQVMIKVDLASGQIVDRQEMENSLGNLICFKDQVISQSPTGLTSYYQVDPLRKQVAGRLADDPQDIWALARQCELLLHDQKNGEALVALRRVHQLQPENDTIRGLLVETMFAALEDDFAGNHEIATELKDLIEHPGQQVEFLRLMGRGLQQAGKYDEAFELYLTLAGFFKSNTENPVAATDQPAVGIAMDEVNDDLICRRDRWIQARLGEIFTSASPPQQDQIDRQVRVFLEEAQQTGAAAALRQFINVFGSHRLAEQARLQLASVLAGQPGGELEAELLLTRLANSPNVAVAKQAMYQQARLQELILEPDLALLVYHQLRTRWPDEVLANGKTAKALYEEALARTRNSDELQPYAWPRGDIQVVSSPVQHVQRNRNVLLRQASSTGPARRGQSYAVTDEWLAIRDRYGQKLDVIPMSIEAGRFSVGNFPSVHTSARSSGHLIVIKVGSTISAVNTMPYDAESPDPRDAVLWRKSQRSTSVGRNYARGRRELRGFGNQVVQLSSTASAHPTDLGICVFQEGKLSCLDPFDGSLVWEQNDKSTIPSTREVELVCTRRHVFLIPNGDEEAIVYSLVNGERLGTRTLATNVTRHFTSAGHQLSGEVVDKNLHLKLTDIWSDQVLWSIESDISTKACLIDNDQCALLQPDGLLRIIDLETGEIAISQQLAAESGLQRVGVIRAGDHYIVATSRAATLQITPFLSEQSGRRPMDIYRGNIYCLDRQTGQQRWREPARVAGYSLLMQQPTDSPILFLARNEQLPSGASRGGSRVRGRAAVLGINRHNGSLALYDNTGTRTISTVNVEAIPTDNTIRITHSTKTFTLTLTDQPVPPEPVIEAEGARSSLGRSLVGSPIIKM